MALDDLFRMLNLSRLMVAALGTMLPFSMVPAFAPEAVVMAAQDGAEDPDESLDVDESDDPEMAMMGYRIRRTDMNFLVERVGLSEDQKAMAMDLYSAYEQSSRDAEQRLREFRDQAEEAAGDDMSVERRNMEMEAFEKMTAQREKLRERLVEDLRLILEPGQQERFVAFERRLRRLDVIGRMQMGSVAGAAADLTGMAERAMRGETPSAGALEALEAYEAEMDKAAVAYGSWFKTTMEEVLKKMRQSEGAMPDAETMEELMKLMMEGMRRSVPLRDANVRFVGRIAAEMEAADGETFEGNFYREAFVDRWRWAGRGGSRVNSAMEQAEKAEGLDDEQKARLEDIRATHAKRSLDILKETAKRTMASDDKRLADPEASMMSWFGGGDDDSQDLETQRQELDNQTIEKIKAVLRPEQIERMGPPLGKSEIEDIEFDEE